MYAHDPSTLRIASLALKDPSASAACLACETAPLAADFIASAAALIAFLAATCVAAKPRQCAEVYGHGPGHVRTQPPYVLLDVIEDGAVDTFDDELRDLIDELTQLVDR